MFSKIFSHERYISRCIYLAVEQEMKTFGEKRKRERFGFLSGKCYLSFGLQRHL